LLVALGVRIISLDECRKTWTYLLVRDAPKWTAKSIPRRAQTKGKPSNEIGRPATVNHGILASPKVLVKEGAHQIQKLLFRSFERKRDAAALVNGDGPVFLKVSHPTPSANVVKN
jgi:hypothetical protein